MKRDIFIRNSIIGVSCSLFISSCCCFGTGGINFDMRKTVVDEGVKNFSEAAVNSHGKINKAANDIPYALFPAGE